MVITEAGGGTRLSSTRSILYGNVSASIKTVGVVGIVTAFITMVSTFLNPFLEQRYKSR